MSRAQKFVCVLLAFCAGAGGLVMLLSARGLVLQAGPADSGRILKGLLLAIVLLLALLCNTALARSAKEPARQLFLGLAVTAEGLIVALLLFLLVFLDTGPRYFTLRAPGGQAVVVREESWLLAGFGEFYLPVGPGLLRDTGVGYTADDGFRPFSAGLYELEEGEDCLTVRCHTGSGGLWEQRVIPFCTIAIYKIGAACKRLAAGPP